MFCNSKLPSCTENSYKHSSQYLFQNYLWSLQDHLIHLVGMEDTWKGAFYFFSLLEEISKTNQELRALLICIKRTQTIY